jgi:hypothetical protein
MRKVFLVFMFCLFSGAVVFSQTNAPITLPRDYAIVNPQVTFSDNQETFTVSFTIRNAGSQNPAISTIRVVNLLDNTILTEDPLPSIGSGASIQFEIPFTTGNFEVGQIPLEIRVGIDEIESVDSPIASNNIARVSVSIPADVARPTTPDNTETPATSAQQPFVQTPEGFLVFGQFVDNATALGIGIGTVIAIVVLWLFSIIVRSIFSKPPEFNNWQPSYANMPTLDPNSTEGRRQAWQNLAQNGLILAAPTQSNLHPVKVLLGTDNQSLSNWRITGVRLSQYDNYGRVTRSQIIASRGFLNRLNNIIKYRARTKPERLQSQVNGLIRSIVKPFKRNVNAKNGFLPVALDLRFEGKHGEVRILFELYQAQAGMWYRLDQWEPAMAVATRTIQESYTFTIHGMSPGEKLKDYHNRLADDMTWLVLEMIRLRPAPTQTPQPQPQAFDVPDTLTDMKPIGSSN